MFPASEGGGGGHHGERDRAALIPAARGGGALRDGDGEEARARQPGCFPWATFWRRRRARIAAATTVDTDATEPEEGIKSWTGDAILEMECALGPESRTGGAILEMECGMGAESRTHEDVAAEGQVSRTDAVIPHQEQEHIYRAPM